LKIFYSFLVILTSAILWLLPVTDAVYDFRTDVKEDSFYYSTGVGVTVANVTLTKALYNDDQSTASAISDYSTDLPVVAGYHTSTRVLDLTGLAGNYTRTLTVSYDFDGLGGSSAINTVADRLGWIWLLCIIVFAPAALASMWIGRK
jgi:hypothetical protein